MRARFACMVFLGVLAWGNGARAHGTERHFGTPINGREAPGQQPDSGSSPAFTLLVLESNSRAILRAIEEGRSGEARERAQQLPQLIRELQKRSERFDAPQRETAVEATSAISECTARIGVAADAADGPSVRRELAELRRLVASMQGFLRESSQP